MLPSNLSCVSFADLSSRPSYVPDDNEPDDRFWVLTLGPSFRYVIPSFDVLAVELRQMRVGGDSKGAGQVYDIFIRAFDVSLMKKPCIDESKGLSEYRGETSGETRKVTS